MEKSDFMALASKKWEEIEAKQKQSETLYDYEKAFEELWVEFGRQALEGSLGEASPDRRKKKET